MTKGTGSPKAHREQINQRNAYRDRLSETRANTAELARSYTTLRDANEGLRRIVP